MSKNKVGIAPVPDSSAVDEAKKQRFDSTGENKKGKKVRPAAKPALYPQEIPGKRHSGVPIQT